MSPSRNRRQSPRESIGQAVFYPNTLPSATAARKTSKMLQAASASNVLSPSSPTSVHPKVHDISTPPRQLSAGVAFDQYGRATEFPFPSQPQHSPTRRLGHLFDGLTFATPQNGQDDTYNRLLYSAGSEPDLSLVTPTALPLSELIDEALIEDGNGDVGSLESPTASKGFKHDSMAPSVLGSDQVRSTGFAFPRPPTTLHENESSFTLGSPAGQSFSPTNRPLPTRQPSWSAIGPRRSSLPHVNIRGNQAIFQPALFGNPTPLPSVVASPTPSPVPTTSSLFPSDSFAFTAQNALHDIFSPQYALQNVAPSPTTVLNQNLYTPPHTESPFLIQNNTLGLHYSTGHPTSDTIPAISASQTSLATPPLEQPKSEIAAHYLRDRALCPSFSRRYVIRDELGSGGFGFVCSAVQTGYKNQIGIEVAVKFIFKDRVQECDYAMLEGEPVESFVLSRCRHPNIIGFKALYEDDEFFYLVQELHGDPWAPGHTLEVNDHHHQLPHSSIAMPKVMPHMPHMPAMPPPPMLNPPQTPGSAFAFSPVHSNIDWSMLSPSPAGLEKRPNMGRRASYDLFECVEHQRFSEDQARKIFKQIVDAVSYLHKKGIYHRDLKDENIVIDRHLTVKIIDFGSAVIEDRSLPPTLYDHFRGTMSYASAEVLNGRHYAAGPADIWSIGIILCIILTGESPFPNTSWAQVGRIKMKRTVPAGALDLMQRCLCTDQRKRATIEQVERHPWLRGMLAHRGSIC